MAGQKRDAKWLKEQLSRVLDWDEMILDVLVDHVVRAAAPGADRSELDEMVQNFMADSPAGIALINDFLAPLSPAAAAARGTASAAAAATGGAAGGGGGKTYAASASSSQPSAGAGGRQPHHQQHHQQRQQPQQRQQQQQQHQQQMRPAGAAAAAQAGAAPTGWQALSGPGAASKASAAGSSSAAVAADEGDDFSRFVVDDRSGGAGGKGGAGSRSKPGSSRDLQALDGAAAGAEKQGGAAAGDSGGGGKVLGMFKAGGRLKAPTAKPVGVRGPDGGALALAASLERQVLNCLGCGKIYDCRSVTNDVLRFLDKGGVCTFCGDAVPLSYKDRQKAAAAAADAAEAAAAVAAAGGAEDAATAAARAFKDRLVEYDRNAAKRTTVIDDQSDFFEIDTNAWLTDQEREELRRRRRLEEEAEAARRKRLTVTIDLIGRKVVLDEDVRKAEAAAAAAAAERAAAAAKAAAAAEALRNTDGDGGGAYGGGVAFSGNALSGSGAPGGPTQQQLAAALDALRRMKASLNPAVAANAAPLFLPTAAATGGGGGAAAAGGASVGGGGSRRFGPAGASTAAAAAAPTAAAGSSRGGGAGTGGAKGGAKGGGRPVGQPPRRHERVQHDLGAEYGFDAFGAEVALDELMGGALLAAAAAEEQQDGPYDICPPDMAPSTSYSGAAKAPSQRSAGAGPRAVPGLPPGVVVLKGYLTMDEQIRIVREIRELGIGPGGFYVPSYNTGARLNLRMMCLGLHWEPRTSKYETIRSSYDGATPPPLPPGLAELCGRCLAAASAAAVAAGGSRFPALKPDICLANFYERSGRLGMHQDKDEMSDSLRAGLPVVSLSLGDAADFLYGSSRDVDEAGSVRLESGDLLVFGGPGRMIFHSVAKVHPNTAPEELIRATGMRPGRLNLTFRQYKAAPA